MSSFSFLVLCFSWFYLTFSDPDVDPGDFLKKFGYIDLRLSFDLPATNNSNVSASNVDIRPAIRRFQTFVGINVTGELDETTLQWMNKPRCGVKDVSNLYHDSAEPYQTYRKWESKRKLSWRLTKYSSKLSRYDALRTIYEAFNHWSSITNIEFFEKSSGDVDIPIEFVTYEHGDGDPFDGPGGTLAHAYYPETGDIHIDDTENWTLDVNWGTNFLQTLTHEIGHSIGLAHSSVHGAVMFPYGGGYEKNFKLHQDDIDGARSLYGYKDSVSTTTSTTPWVWTENPSIPSFECPDYGYNTRDRVEPEITDDVDSWFECFELCERRSGCRFWTWHHDGAGYYAHRCITMTDVSEKVEDPNAVSGNLKRCQQLTTTTSTISPSIPAFNCPDVGYNTRDRVDPEITDGVDHWVACADICRKRSGCRYWSWHHAGAGFYAFRCVTMTDVYERVQDDNAVSGSKKCSG